MRERAKDPEDREQALRWLTRLHSGESTAADRQAFQQWLAQDEAHWREYSKARRLWASLEILKSHEFPEMDQARAILPPINPLARRQRALTACFALFALVFLGTSSFWNNAISRTYQTALGEQKTITLADGSQVDLNTDSELRVVMMPKLRLLHLRRGEALFDVAHDTARPFDVYAGGATARAIGTRFGVQRRQDEVQVIVQEGIVAVGNGSQNPRRVLRDQAIDFGAAGALPAPRAVAAEDLLAWRQGKLVFTSQPLSEVLAQLQRYHAIKIRLDDPTLGKLKLSGVFNTAQWQPLLSSIEATLNLTSEVTASGELLLKRQVSPRP